MATETCEGCGFDAGDYTHADLLGTLRALAPMWRTMTEGIDGSVLAIRPAPGVWSAIEYAAHSRDVTGVMGYLLHLALTQDHPVLAAPPPETPEPEIPATLAAAVAQLDKNVARMNAKASGLGGAEWTRPLTIAEETVDIGWIVGHAVHDATHHLRDVARGLHAVGAGAPSQRGTLVQVSASDGGVPKSALSSATIGRNGVEGDQQAERRHHGRPFQALCLWSDDVIGALRAEGHTVYPGAAGENLTVAGIDWATIRPGVRVRIGSVLAEISAFATPCAKNAQWFAGGSFRRIDHHLHPGASRAYAWVLEGGTVAPGDAVLVEPPPA
jgi:MOSC domain-containing protein YiiM